MYHLSHYPMMHGETSGTAELSELLAATMLVVVALSIFFASLGTALVRSAEMQDSNHLGYEADELCATLRSSSLLSSSPGVFPMEKLEALDAEQIAAAFPPEQLGYQYSIILEDTSTYTVQQAAFRFNTSSPDQQDVYISSLPGIMEAGEWERHTCRLTVMIWEAAT